LAFHFVLAGHALEQLPLVLLAWQRALAQGLTRMRSRLALEQVQWQDEDNQLHPVWSADTPRIQSHTASLQIPPWPEGKNELLLRIHTPLRLQHQGRPLRPQQLTAHSLISAVSRRAALVLEFHANQPDWGERVPATAAQALALRDERELRWFDWVRYSSRQQQEMTLGGVVGDWRLQGTKEVLSSIWPWLWLGQWLHVGKNATMGLGGYRLTAT
jgi:hypothetical protein